MKRLLVALACLSLISCGGGGGSSSSTPPANVTIAISPLSVSVPAGSTQQFTASVSGTTNTAVTWQVDGTEGGNSTVGTIDSSGLYTAPGIAPSPADVTVTAVSQADTSKSASATVTITIIVSVFPAAATVQTGLTQQFSATVTASNTAVTWRVNGTAGGNSTVGTIASTGLYTAPAAVPAGTVTVSAVAQADTAQAGTADVTVAPVGGYSNQTLNGSYAFSMTGEDVNGFFLALGSFTADGNGNLLNGVEDVNDGTGIHQSMLLTGYYSVAPDGRGVARLYNDLGYLDLSLAVLSQNRVKFTVFDTIAGASGDMLKSDSSAFNNTSILGNYAFGLDGFDINFSPATTVGVFTADGAGHINTGAEDLNENSAVTSSLALTGSYSVDPSTGRGTASLVTVNDTRTFAFQVVSADTLLFMELDFAPASFGKARRQQALCCATSNLSGDYAFQMALPGIATGQSGETATAGRFTANGGGSLLSGLLDDNNAGTVTQNATFTGNYSIAPDGRGTAGLTTAAPSSFTINVVFYMVSDTEAFVMSSDPNIVQSGPILAQQGGPFDASSFSGGFALKFVDSFNGIWTLGRASLDGVGTLSGSEDVNDAATLTADDQVTGTYSVSSSAGGRGTAAITSSAGITNLAFYAVSGSQVLAIQIDSGVTSAGTIEKQM